MITIFTTAKPFIVQIKVNQINALKSWKALSPLVNLMFALVEAHGRYPLQAYIKYDIILLDGFLTAIQRITWIAS